MSSKWFRYGFLIFFLTMFGNMVFQTYLVGAGASSLREAIKLFWTFRVPWGWTYTAGTVADWVAQFSFGFYSLMAYMSTSSFCLSTSDVARVTSFRARMLPPSHTTWSSCSIAWY